MDSTTAVKRTLPILISNHSCYNYCRVVHGFSRDKPIPTIENRDDIYLTISEAGRNYQVTNKEIYEKLKKASGLSILIDAIDKDILQGVHGDENYWALVTDDEINGVWKREIFLTAKKIVGRGDWRKPRPNIMRICIQATGCEARKR